MVEILQVWKNNWKKPKTCRTTVIYDLRESEILYWKSCWEEQLTEKLCLVQQARLRGKIRCARVDGILIDLKFNLKKPFKTDDWKENLFNLIKLTSSSILRQLSLVNSLFFFKNKGDLKGRSILLIILKDFLWTQEQLWFNFGLDLWNIFFFFPFSLSKLPIINFRDFKSERISTKIRFTSRHELFSRISF